MKGIDILDLGNSKNFTYDNLILGKTSKLKSPAVNDGNFNNNSDQPSVLSRSQRYKFKGMHVAPRPL